MGRWRYFAQHALTGEILNSALPLSGVQFGNELNGPGSLTGTLAPKWVRANASVLEPAISLIYAEADGFLRWGGLIWSVEAEDDQYKLEAASWSSYLMKRYDTHGNLNGRGPYTYQDPCIILRDIWAYAQEQPDGDLNVIVDATTSNATTGTPAEPWHSYWYETPLLGDLMDDLVSEDGAPQYTNACSFQANGTIERRIRLGYPRLGARRTDITFQTGINIISAPAVDYSGDAYANVVIGTGSGEGTATRFAVDPVRDGRLRMEEVLALPTVNGNDVLGRRARARRRQLQVMGQVQEITVRDHPNAPLGSWQIGDDVPVAVHNQWVSYTGWARIIADSYKPGDRSDTATLSLQRADAFHYGSEDA